MVISIQADDMRVDRLASNTSIPVLIKRYDLLGNKKGRTLITESSVFTQKTKLPWRDDFRTQLAMASEEMEELFMEIGELVSS